MLKALYDYAIRHELTLPEGYINKTVKAYILLYGDGEFQDIRLVDKKEPPIPAPDIGSLANGKDKSNVLLEKRSVVLPEEASAKSQFFLNALKEGGQIEPMLTLCANALENPETAQAIRARLDERGVKASDRISFLVNEQSILKSDKTQEWWQSFRQQFTKKQTAETVPCLITGEQTIPVATTTPINGLHSVGGHARGDALICFDKNAFCSYGLKKAENAPVSESAFAAVKAALDSLLEDAQTLAGMKFVHWYDFELEKKIDPLEEMFTPEEDWGFDDLEDDFDEQDSEELKALEKAQQEERERGAIKAANELVQSAESGKRAVIPEEASYFILMLTGVGGRIMIRHYERGRYADLQRNLKLWYEDLTLVNRNGAQNIPSCKLVKRFLVLLKYQQSDRNVFERMGKELAGASPMILNAILSGGMLPEGVAVRALAYIRSKMLSSDENAEKELFGVDACVWQWLKVWLLRNREKRGKLMKEYNPTYDSNAYHCGAMMAVYEAIQKEAMRDVNTTIVQRFYSSAIQTPALVLCRLSQMSIHHLEKMENEWLANAFKERLQAVSTSIHGALPRALTLEQQSEFALGYYQMGAEMNREKIERIAAKKAKEEASAQKKED